MKRTKIVCRGYGSAHGYANGRLWFVCSKCRWSVAPSAAKESLGKQVDFMTDYLTESLYTAEVEQGKDNVQD